MEYNEFVLIGIGTAISVIGYFLKRENQRLVALEKIIHEINLTLSKNEALDLERWASANKRLEDRRADIRNLYQMLQKKKDQE
tara:strand:- start:252 stop:500 length:249 start_codon:yes stop_codon:yes gene_type:complete